MPTTNKIIRLSNYYFNLIYNNSRDFIFRNVLNKSTLPECLILGAQKAGTNSLFYYFDQHPQLRGAYKKEIRFFSTDFYFKGYDFYEKQFPTQFKACIYYEATPEYICYPQVA